MNMTPQFRLAMQKCLHLGETLGRDHPATTSAMMLAMEYAPEELKDWMREEIVSMGLLPPVCGYLEDGEQVYSLDDLAGKLGISVQEAQASFDRLIIERSAAGLDTILIDPALIHRTQ